MMIHTQKPVVALLLLLLPVAIGCRDAAKPAATQAEPAPEGDDLDPDNVFDSLLTAIGSVAGERFQFMEMEAMKSATYQYGGPLEDIVVVVTPLATKAGYVAVDDDAAAEAFKQGHEQIPAVANMNMTFVGSKSFRHPNGNSFSISRSDVTSSDPENPMKMQMLSVHIMNPKKMSDMGEALMTTP